MKSYDFITQNRNPKQKEGNKKCLKYWQDRGYKVWDVSENENYFKSGIDLIKKLGLEETTIDVKTNFQVYKTGNIPFELIEISPLDKNRNIKPGWGYNNVDEINFCILELNEMVILPLKEFREWVFTIDIPRRRGFAAWHLKPFPYFTLGILVPLEEIKKHFKAVKLE